MIYRVVHTTEYYYGESVPLCHNVIRMRPRDTVEQVCLENELWITPEPAARRDLLDFFGNHMTWISVQEPHEMLKVESHSEVEVTPSTPPADTDGQAWEQVVQTLADDPALLPVKEFTFASPYVPCEPEMAAYARASFPPGRPLLPCVLDLTQRIHQEFTFDPRATTVGTPVHEVLEHRRGVCQDFAHLQISCLRSLGLAARYVSGYVLTQPLPGRQRLSGADASHAWVSVYIPEHGWVDFDPTNNVLPCGEHVTIGWARDYDDVSPLRGVIVGGHRQSLFVGVDVEPLASPEVQDTVENGKADATPLPPGVAEP